MTNILVTGSNGQLGSELKSLQAAYPDFQFTFSDAADLDITSEEKIEAVFSNNKFTHLINAAAYTAVDKAEEDVATCTLVNETAVGYLAKACTKHNIAMVHVSSDYVYHNQMNSPMTEAAPTTPKGVYAATKLGGDLLALQHTDAIILRTSWVYSSFGHNFVKSMIKLATSRPELSIVYDQIGAPTYANDLAKAILDIIVFTNQDSQDFTSLKGIYHYSNEGISSWYDFARSIFKITNKDIKLNAILSEQYPTPAQRPTYSVLDKAKIKSTFELTIPHWEQSLEACINLLPKD